MDDGLFGVAQMSNTPEGKVKQKVRDIFKKHKVPYVHVSGSMYSKAGAEDYNATVNAFTLAVECKAGDNGQTQNQIDRQEAIEKEHGTYLVINEKNLADLEYAINVLRNRKWSN